MIRCAAILVVSAIQIAPHALTAQENRVSPHETVSVDLNGKQVSISYGRPYLKGREFGKDVAPYGQVWRLGADEATKLTVPFSAKLEGGPELRPGSYSLWAIPGPDKWTLIVNKKADTWGTRYDQSEDLARFDLPVQQTAPVEEFTITITKRTDRSAQLSFAWGKQKVTTTLTAQQ